MTNLWNKIKIWIKEKLKTTVFGDAYDSFSYMYTKNHIAFIVEMVIAYLLCILASGFLMLNIMNLGGDNYSITLWNCFAAWLSKGIILSVILFIVIQVLVGRFIRLFGIKYRHDDERNIDVATEGTYGTADVMTREEMQETFIMDTLKNNKNTIFGKDPENEEIVVAQKESMLKTNRNCLMIAGPSAGKSACFVIPLIFQIIRRGESAIVNDPKSELFKICSEVAKKCGYEVRIMNLNPMFLENSDPCNFLQYVGEDVDKAQVMSNAIITNTTSEAETGDFWNEGAVNLLQGVMLLINIGNMFPESQKNLPFIFTWLVENTLEEIESIFENLPDNHPAKAPGMIFVGGEAKVKAQTLQGLRIKLKLFNSPKLKKILSKTEGGLDILNPGRKKCLYFVGSNDQDSSMEPIVSLFFTLLYQELVRYADMRLDQVLPVKVHMVLDEYSTVKIPDFEKKLSTVRSRGIITYIILQDINQLKKKHPMDAWRTVVNDCDYHLLLKTNDTETMKWWVEMVGEMTIKVKNAHYSKNKIDVVDIHNSESVSEGQGTRKVFTEHEIRTLGNKEILVMVTLHNPVKLKTFFWKTDHPYANAVKEVLPVQHYPLWRLKEDGIVGDDFDYDNEPSYVLELKPDTKIDIDKSYNPDNMLNAFKGTRKASKKVVLNLIKKESKEKEPEEKEEEDLVQVRVIKEPPKKQKSQEPESPPKQDTPKPAYSNNLFEEEPVEVKKKPQEKPQTEKPVKEKRETKSDPKPPAEQPKQEKTAEDDFKDLFEEFDSFDDFEV